MTKSDVLGHLLPRLGISNWVHIGIASLYTNIYENGYKMIYLTSRPLGMSNSTRKFL